MLFLSLTHDVLWKCMDLVLWSRQGKVLISVVNYHQRDVYLDEGTLLGRAELLSDSAEHVTTEGEGTDAAQL